MAVAAAEAGDGPPDGARKVARDAGRSHRTPQKGNISLFPSISYFQIAQHTRILFYKGHLIRATLLTSLDRACDFGPSLVHLEAQWGHYKVEIANYILPCYPFHD